MVQNSYWKTPGNERLETDLCRYAPGDPLEAACVLRLAPGGYSVIVQGHHGLAGNAMVEVFKVDE